MIVGETDFAAVKRGRVEVRCRVPHNNVVRQVALMQARTIVVRTVGAMLIFVTV
jgi:hypothetical protein